MKKKALVIILLVGFGMMVFDPAKTRDVLGLALEASLNAPVDDVKFGVLE